ncbi:hypothetical protein Tco_1281129, partial [Tanacetum coccineum]
IRWQTNVPAQPSTRMMSRLYHALREYQLLPSIDCICNVPAFYLQQYVDLSYNEGRTGVYSVNLMKMFDLSADLLRKALSDHSVNPKSPSFVLPSSGDHGVDFVNELGYPETYSICLLNMDEFMESSPKTKVDYARANMRRVLLKGSRLFYLSQCQATKASLKNPKKKATPLTHPLWDDPPIFQQSSYYPTVSDDGCCLIQIKPLQWKCKACNLHKAGYTQGRPTTTTPAKQSKPAPSPTKGNLPRLSLDQPYCLTSGTVGRSIDQGSSVETLPKLHEVVEGKAVVSEEQVAHSLIDMSKKKRSTDQFILARRDQTPPDSKTGPSSQPDAGHSDKAHEALAGPDPEPMEEDQTGSDSGKLHTETSTPPVIAPFTEVSSSKPSSLVTPPPINTEATTITTSLPEITPFIALQLRVARLEQEMSEVKKTDHSADVLATIRTQVPTAVDNYLGTKLDDSLLKVLERHTADLIEKYSVLPGPESVKNQESEKSPKEIIKAKKEKDEEKQDSTYSIRSTDKLMDKEVADKVKDHKRKHDSDDDEDDDDDDEDEGPLAGSNQGRSTKRRKSDSAASGSANPPPKADDQSSKKQRESEAS